MILPSLADPIEVLFADLNAKESSRRDKATKSFLHWVPTKKFKLRCPSGKRQGWSVIAYTARANVNTSKWSRLRFEELTRDAPPDALSAITGDGVPDGAWVWLGCMNAAAQDASRKSRLLSFRDNLERRWTPEGLLAGIVALRDRIHHLENPVKAAFERAWRVEWDYRVKSNGLNREANVAIFVRDWTAASLVEPLPALSFAQADHLANSVFMTPEFWLGTPENLKVADTILGRLQEPVGLGSVIDLARGAVEAYLHPDRPVENRHIKGWAPTWPSIAAHLARQQLANHLTTALPASDRRARVRL